MRAINFDLLGSYTTRNGVCQILTHSVSYYSGFSKLLPYLVFTFRNIF